MAVLLHIETATSVCSVAVSRNGNILSAVETNEGNKHAEKITLFIEQALESAGVEMNELDAIAVSSGPGSYTGLRIGVSTAKGLCFALDKALISISTLQSLAYGCIHPEIIPGWHAGINDWREKISDGQFLFCPMIDARRMEVYCAIYDHQLNEVRKISAEIIDENSFSDLLAERKICFFGDGAGKCKSVLAHHANAIFIDSVFPSASAMSVLAEKKFQLQQFEDVALFEPFYLKEFVGGKKKEF